MTDERKQAEDAMAENGFNFALFELENEHSAKNLLNAFKSYASLKVAEVTKEMYPAAFIEWIGTNANMLYFPNFNGRWLLSRVIMSENPSIEYDEYTTNELFEYWKQNIRK